MIRKYRWTFRLVYFTSMILAILFSSLGMQVLTYTFLAIAFILFILLYLKIDIRHKPKDRS